MPFNLVAPTYTASRLERMAITLLKGRIKGSTTVPIDIDFILEQEPGVLLDYIPGIKTRFGVAGWFIGKTINALELLLMPRLLILLNTTISIVLQSQKSLPTSSCTKKLGKRAYRNRKTARGRNHYTATLNSITS